MFGAVHFVGFKPGSERFNNAERVFGPPDFVHRVYDGRCIVEIMHGDTVVFAKGDEHQPVEVYSYDDSDFN